MSLEISSVALVGPDNDSFSIGSTPVYKKSIAKFSWEPLEEGYGILCYSKDNELLMYIPNHSIKLVYYNA